MSAAPCKFFPNCKNEKCTFSHDSTGPKPCKYGSECTNPHCFFSHPDRVNPEEKAESPPKIPCRYGSNCNNKSRCPFTHDQGENNPKACKFGSNCSNDQCPYTHDKEASPVQCKYGSKCKNKQHCSFSHPDSTAGVGGTPNPKECKYGSSCKIQQCPFTHSQEAPMACKYGSGCTNEHCIYSHPLERPVCFHPNPEPPEAGPKKSKFGVVLLDTNSVLQPSQLQAAVNALSAKAASKSIDGKIRERLQTLLPDAPGRMISQILKANWTPLERSQLLAVVVHSVVGPKDSHAVLSALSHHSGLIAVQRCSVERCLKRLWATSSTDPAFGKLKEEHAAHNRGLDELVQQQAEFERQLSEITRPRTIESSALGQSIRREAFRLAPFQVKEQKKVFTNPLPALAKRNKLIAMLNSGQQLIIVRGETGSGKSTQLPQYVADFFGPTKKVVCTQPRKIAAITLAERVAYEYAGGAVRQTSKEVGFKVGSKGQNKHQGGSVITFMTEALLLKSLLKSRDSLNQHCGWHAIILDEAHERSVNTDLLLGLVKERLAVDRNLRVIVTSATLDTELFIKYFTTELMRPPLLEIPGRMFPVEEVYVPMRDDQNLVSAATRLAFELHRDTPLHAGDILIFLAAQEDTEAAKSQLKTLLAKPGNKGATVLCLYGKQAPEEHEKAFAPTPKDTRKIVFSTNVAETSVTIDGIRMVIDSGVCKENRFDAKRNMFLLEETAISQSSATQRKGRAGRTAPGSVYRLYSEEDYEKLRTGQVAELLRCPLGLTILKLLERKILISNFKFIEPPSAEDISVAAEELFFLGAIENPSAWTCSECTLINCSSCAPDCAHTECEACAAKRPTQFALTPETRLTEFGVFAARADVDPRIARILFVGAQLGFPDTALTLACLLSVEGNVKFRGGDTKMQLKADLLHAALSRQLDCVDKSDVLLIFKIYERWATLDNWWVDAVHGNPKHYAVDEVQDVKDDEPERSFLTEGWLQQHNAELENEKAGQEQVDQEEQVGPAEDAVSLVSGFDDGASVASEAKTERGYKHVQALKKKWCRGWSLNSKSLGIAEGTRRELDLVMRNNNLKMEQTSTASDEIILKLFFAGYFLNLASKCGRQYRSLGSHMLSLIHPSSPLLGQQTLPDNVSYFRMFSTSKNFLLLVVPVSTEEKDLRQIIPAALLPAFKAKLAPITVIAQRLPSPSTCYSSSLLKAAIGIKNKDKSAIEEQYSVTLEVEYTHPAHVMVWGATDQVTKASQAIAAKIKVIESQLLREAQEEAMLGSTRASFGAGCVVQRLLLGNEFLRLSLTNLPLNFEIGELQARTEIFGTITSTGLELLKSGKSQWGTVTFEDPKAAKFALESLDQQPCRPSGPPINVKPAGIVHDSQHSISDTTVVVSWASQASSGSAVVKYRTAKEANECLRQAPALGYTVSIRLNRATIAKIKSLSAASTEAYNRGDKALATELKQQKLALQETGKFFAEEEVKGDAPVSFAVEVQGLDPSIDELHLSEHFRKFGNVRRVQVNRGTHMCTQFEAGKCERGANCKFSHTLESKGNEVTKVDETTLATINSIIMQRAGEVVLRSEETVGENGRAEMRVRMCSLQAARRMLKQVCTRQYRPAHGQLLRATVTLSHVCSFHKELFATLGNEFEKVSDAAAREGIDVHVDHAIPGRTKVLLSTLLGASTEENDTQRTNALNAARIALNQLLTCKIINHPRKFVMFSSAGRQFMQNWAAQKKQAYIHWDHRFQTIKLYGISPDLEILEANILDMINTLGANFNVLRLPLAPASVRAARKLQSQIRSVDVMEVQFEKAALVLTTNSEGEGRVRNLLRENGIVIEKSQAAPTNQTDCAVCFCPIEGPFQLKACGHIFCRECIAGAAGGSLPLKCPTCNQLWIWRDVVTLLGPKLAEIQKLAYDAFLTTATGRKTYGNCPSRQGCEQKFVQDKEDPRYSRIFDCDQCHISYCLACSSELASPIETHDDVTCEEFRRDFHIPPDLKCLLRLPNVSPCPSCGTLIFKDGGCFHMTCYPPKGCGAHFCWGCMLPFEGNRNACTCAGRALNAWGGGEDPTCRYVYHHMAFCDRHVHKPE